MYPLVGQVYLSVELVYPLGQAYLLEQACPLAGQVCWLVVGQAYPLVGQACPLVVEPVYLSGQVCQLGQVYLLVQGHLLYRFQCSSCLMFLHHLACRHRLRSRSKYRPRLGH